MALEWSALMFRSVQEATGHSLAYAKGEIFHYFFFFFFSTVHFVICTESFLVSFISLKVDLFPVSFELNWHKVTPYIYMFKLCNIYNCVLSFFFLIFF